MPGPINGGGRTVMPGGAAKVEKCRAHHELGPAPLAGFGKIRSTGGLDDWRPPEILMNFAGDVSHVGCLLFTLCSFKGKLVAKRLTRLTICCEMVCGVSPVAKQLRLEQELPAPCKISGKLERSESANFRQRADRGRRQQP